MSEPHDKKIRAISAPDPTAAGLLQVALIIPTALFTFVSALSLIGVEAICQDCRNAVSVCWPARRKEHAILYRAIGALFHKKVNDFYQGGTLQRHEGCRTMIQHAWYLCVYKPAEKLLHRYEEDNRNPRLHSSDGVEFIVFRHRISNVMVRVSVCSGGITRRDDSVLFESDAAPHPTESYACIFGAYVLIGLLQTQAREGNLIVELWRPSHGYAVGTMEEIPSEEDSRIQYHPQRQQYVISVNGTECVVPLGWHRMLATLWAGADDAVDAVVAS